MAVGDTVGEVTCPRCGAKPGEPCRTASGSVMHADAGNPHTRYFHSARERAYRAFRKGRQGSLDFKLRSL